MSWPKGRKQSEEHQKKRNETLRKIMSTDEYKEKMRIVVKKRWENKEYKEKVRTSLIKVYAYKKSLRIIPEKRSIHQIRSEAAKKRWATPGFREKIQKSLTKNTEERFWSKVDIKDTDECWEWKAMRLKPIGANNGYGQFEYNGKLQLAHRVSFLLSGGILTEKKPWVLHLCDNRACVNPTHLYAGTHQENMNDMKLRGRSCHKPGEKSGSSKLTDQKVLEIRDIGNKISDRKIAKLYGIGRTTVKHILRRETWRHI
jgi:hypothetical protein